MFDIERMMIALTIFIFKKWLSGRVLVPCNPVMRGTILLQTDMLLDALVMAAMNEINAAGRIHEANLERAEVEKVLAIKLSSVPCRGAGGGEAPLRHGHRAHASGKLARGDPDQHQHDAVRACVLAFDFWDAGMA
jgi:hypothetical protein